MQTVDLVQATWNATANAVQGLLSQQCYGRRVVLMTLQAPKNSTLTIYRGHIPNFAGMITHLFPADVRTYDSDTLGGPIVIGDGEVATFQWTGGNTGVGQVAQCNMISEVL